MRLARGKRFGAGVWVRVIWIAVVCVLVGGAQGIRTTMVQGTVYLADGTPGSGTLTLTWPAFTTADGEAIAAGVLNAPVGADGALSVSLAPNQGASPAGLFYTAVYHMSDGTVSTEY